MGVRRKRPAGGWGGVRTGAGRPREFHDKVQKIVLLEREDAEALEDLAYEAGLTFSKYLRRLIQRHLRAKGRLPRDSG